MRSNGKHKRRKPANQPTTAIATTTPAPTERELVIKEKPMLQMLDRLDGKDGSVRDVEDRLNSAIGCRTSAVANTLLAQVVTLEHGTEDIPSAKATELLTKATAMLAELRPTNATEAMLAAQMVGSHLLAMRYMASAIMSGQTVEGADRFNLRATRLMRVFMEQAESMARHQGKTGLQRVVVERVDVAAGGQAIVGAVSAGRGPGGSSADR